MVLGDLLQSYSSSCVIMSTKKFTFTFLSLSPYIWLDCRHRLSLSSRWMKTKTEQIARESKRERDE